MRVSSVKFAVAATLLTLPLAAFAGPKGVNEVAGTLSYNDIEDTTLTIATLSYGRYLTPRHEIGVTGAYMNLDVDGLGSVDGSELGAFYHFNIPMEGILQPYFGVGVQGIFGDLGDAYDMGYNATVGVKVYPYENAGINIGLSYQSLQGAENFIDDSNGTSLSVGLMLRF